MPSPSGANKVKKLQKNIGTIRNPTHRGVSPLASAIFMITISLVGAAFLIILSHQFFDSEGNFQTIEEYSASAINNSYFITKTDVDNFAETVRIRVNTLPVSEAKILGSGVIQETKNQIVSLSEKIHEKINDETVKQELLQRTEKALEQSNQIEDKVNKNEQFSGEDLTGIKETLSDLVEYVKIQIEENKIDEDLGHEILEQTVDILEYQSAQFEKALIIPVRMSVNSNIQKTWYVIQKTPAEVDRIAKELGDHGFKLTATVVDLGDGNVIQGVRVTPPDSSEIQNVEMILQNQDEFCIDEYELMFKSKDGSPVCVFPESVPLLVERGIAFSFV